MLVQLGLRRTCSETTLLVFSRDGSYFVCTSGLMGKDNLEALKIDELNEAVSELFQSLVKLYFEQDKDKKVCLCHVCV